MDSTTPHTDPAYYDRMSALLDEFIAKLRGQAIAYEEYLIQIAEIARRVEMGPGDDLPSTIDTAGKRALFNNLGKEIGKLYSSDRAEKIWSDRDVAAFRASASPELWLALRLALDTGQRQGDLLRLPWSAFDGAAISLTQSKTGADVTIPCTKELRAALETATRCSTLILTNSRGQPWTPGGFRSSWQKACRVAGITGVTFNDLRGTAVTRLAEAGCTVPEIASITGHSLRNAATILERYRARTRKQASAAIEKLDEYRRKRTT